MRILRRERILLILLAIGMIMRLNDLTHAGYLGDMVSFNMPWALSIQQFGLFRIYAVSPETNYPPIYLFILGIASTIVAPLKDNSISLGFVVLTKLFSVIAELAIIGIVYRWLSPSTRLKWIIPLVLALSPGLIATTAFWGQTDSILTLFLVLSIIALNRNQSRMSWVWFAVAMLMKFQAVVLLPMLGILSLRRFGIRATIIGILLAGVIIAIVLTPFTISSGLENTLNPFSGATDHYPIVTFNAFNLWYVVIPPLWKILPAKLTDIPVDTNVLIGSLSIRQISLLMFGSYVLLVVIMMWRQYSAQREFLWATALYIGFFMLPTQMHERYLYPAATLSIIAIAQERRMWPIAAMLIVTYACNIVVIPDVPFYWFGLDLKALLGGIKLLSGILNLLCLAAITLFILGRDKKPEDSTISEARNPVTNMQST